MMKTIYYLSVTTMISICIACTEGKQRKVQLTEYQDLNSVTTKASISFETQDVNLGNISKDDSCAFAIFNFTNTGGNALLLLKLRTSCSCTIADYPKKPIKPGEKGKIKIKLLTEGKSGIFNKTIYVKSNAENSYEVLHIKGKID